MKSLSLVALLAAGLALAAPVPSSAASDDPVTRKKVQTYLDLAADLFRSGDYEGALGELRRAEALSDLAVVRYNIARCLEELHRDAEAIAAYQKYLALQDSTDGAADRQRRAKEAIEKLAATATPTVGTLEVSCLHPSASVLIVGLMTTPVTCPWRSAQVPPGLYDIQTMTPGQPPTVVRAQVVAGMLTVVSGQGVAAPQAAPPAATAAPVSVRFVAAREGDEFTVTVTARKVPPQTCKAPCELALVPGRYEVSVEGSTSYTDDLRVPNTASVVRIDRRRNGFLALGITSFVVGGLALSVGLALVDYEGATATSGALIGSGLVIGLGGGITGMVLKRSNSLDLEPAERTSFAPRLLAVGATPVRGGAMLGASFAF